MRGGRAWGSSPPLHPHPLTPRKPPTPFAMLPGGLRRGPGTSPRGCIPQQTPSLPQCLPPYASSPPSLQLCPPAPCKIRTPRAGSATLVPRPAPDAVHIHPSIRLPVPAPARPQRAGMPEKCHGVAAGLRAPAAGPALHPPAPSCAQLGGRCQGAAVRREGGRAGGRWVLLPQPRGSFLFIIFSPIKSWGCWGVRREILGVSMTRAGRSLVSPRGEEAHAMTPSGPALLSPVSPRLRATLSRVTGQEGW